MSPIIPKSYINKMKIYTIKATEKFDTGSIDVSLRTMYKWMELVPGTEVAWRSRKFSLTPGGTPTDFIYAPGIGGAFSQSLKECLENLVVNISAKWRKLLINYEGVDYPYYFLNFCTKLTDDIVCKEQSTILATAHGDFYFKTCFYQSKIMPYNIFYNPALKEGYQYVVTDKVVEEIKKRQFSGISFDKDCVFLAKEKIKKERGKQ